LRGPFPQESSQQIVPLRVEEDHRWLYRTCPMRMIETYATRAARLAQPPKNRSPIDDCTTRTGPLSA
jgi:hypothetical protein